MKKWDTRILYSHGLLVAYKTHLSGQNKLKVLSESNPYNFYIHQPNKKTAKFQNKLEKKNLI